MYPAIEKCNTIRHIVRIRQMLRQWRKKAVLSPSPSPPNRITGARIPPDVPAGHVAVCVGSSCKRFIVRATYLNHPVFKKLLVQAEEEYGFTNQGPLAIPCHESAFEEILRYLSESSNSTRFAIPEDFQICCHVSFRDNLDVLGESLPLITGLADKSVC